MNPITQAVKALLNDGKAFTAPAGVAMRIQSAVSKLGVLDHEAATEEWRCPNGHGLAKDERNYPCLLCGAMPTLHLVVPFRSEGGDHADG